jgi:hypothetical protein
MGAADLPDSKSLPQDEKRRRAEAASDLNQHSKLRQTQSRNAEESNTPKPVLPGHIITSNSESFKNVGDSPDLPVSSIPATFDIPDFEK